MGEASHRFVSVIGEVFFVCQVPGNLRSVQRG